MILGGDALKVVDPINTAVFSSRAGQSLLRSNLLSGITGGVSTNFADTYNVDNMLAKGQGDHITKDQWLGAGRGALDFAIIGGGAAAVAAGTVSGTTAALVGSSAAHGN